LSVTSVRPSVTQTAAIGHVGQGERLSLARPLASQIAGELGRLPADRHVSDWRSRASVFWGFWGARSGIHFAHVDRAAGERLLFHDEAFHQIGPAVAVVITSMRKVVSSSRVGIRHPAEISDVHRSRPASGRRKLPSRLLISDGLRRSGSPWLPGER
jgi:hypothetical protein